MHIGSQITDLAPFDAAYGRMADLVRDLRDAGHDIDHVDAGGGLGIPYRLDDPPPPDPAAYAEIIRRRLGNLGARILFEPGRLFAGNAGILVTEVIYVKQGAAKTFVIVDAGMNDLIPPDPLRSLARHPPGHAAQGQAEDHRRRRRRRHLRDRDYLALDREIPAVESGDLIAIMTAGAYGAVQGSTYNSKTLAPEILVNGDKWSVVRPASELRRPDRIGPYRAVAGLTDSACPASPLPKLVASP